MFGGGSIFGAVGGGFGGGFPPRQVFEEQYHCYSVAYADKAHLEVRAWVRWVHFLRLTRQGLRIRYLHARSHELIVIFVSHSCRYHLSVCDVCRRYQQ